MRKKRGFTLIELLVVISIIALLLAILMPALGEVKERAKRTVCATRLRGIGTASAMYANENNDKLPYDINLNGRGIGLLNYSLFEKGGSIPAKYTGWINQGRLFESDMIENPKVFYCPSEKRVAVMQNYDIYWVGGVLRPEADRRERMLRVLPTASDVQQLRVRGSYLARPIFQDEKTPTKITENFNTPYMSDRWTYGGTMHKGKYFNVLYKDTHISSYKDTDLEVMDCGDDGQGKNGSEFDTDGAFNIKRGWDLLKKSN